MADDWSSSTSSSGSQCGPSPGGVPAAPAVQLPNPADLALRGDPAWDTDSSSEEDPPAGAGGFAAALQTEAAASAAAAPSDPGPYDCFCTNAVLHGTVHSCCGHCRARTSCTGRCGAELPPLPAGWEAVDAAGSTYYHRRDTGVTQWDRPWEPPPEEQEKEVMATTTTEAKEGKERGQKEGGKKLKRAERERLERERMKAERIEKERKWKEEQEEKKKAKAEEKDKDKKKKKKKQRKKERDGDDSDAGTTATSDVGYLRQESSMSPGTSTSSRRLTVPPQDTGQVASPPPAARWKDGAACEGCHAAFTVTKRRHHCRVCGGVFCSGCTPHRVTLRGTEKERVCKNCNLQQESGAGF